MVQKAEKLSTMIHTGNGFQPKTSERKFMGLRSLSDQLKARNFLFKYYYTNEAIRNDVNIFEPHLTDLLNREGKPWKFCCKFHTLRQFLVFQKLCDYYCIEWKFCKVCKTFQYRYSRKQRLIPSVSGIPHGKNSKDEFVKKIICHNTGCDSPLSSEAESSEVTPFGEYSSIRNVEYQPKYKIQDADVYTKKDTVFFNPPHCDESDSEYVDFKYLNPSSSEFEQNISDFN
ncbi:hypothetical protein RF11_03516 [Thelohanellus kitauei]|uniref:Uncharacterized protein n=1 Tax=Thelohanellus kitauei TaxID=669202 RepID=A0A0C2M4Z1_THEKT|nr:hypothetical protein RF11_03516 [Thelohanellus kitauei]